MVSIILLSVITNGTHNTAIGNTKGYQNIAVGNTIGTNNTAVG